MLSPEENTGQADGDAEIPEDDRGHQRAGRADRLAAHAREQPHGEAEPAVLAQP